MSQGYRTRTLRILEKDLFPVIGKNPISELIAPLLLDALRLIEKRNVYIAHRAKQTASQIMRYAVTTGRADRDIAADLTGALKPHSVKHAATLLAPPQRLGSFLAVSQLIQDHLLLSQLFSFYRFYSFAPAS